MGEGDGVGAVESLEVDLADADVEVGGDEGTEKVAAPARMERGRREFVEAIDGFVVVRGGELAHLPYQVVGGFGTEPRVHDAADAEAAVLHAEELPRALQPLPERHEAFLVVLNIYHNTFLFVWVHGCVSLGRQIGGGFPCPHTDVWGY